MGTEPGGRPKRVAPGLAARVQTRVRVANRIAEHANAALRSRLALLGSRAPSAVPAATTA